MVTIGLTTSGVDEATSNALLVWIPRVFLGGHWAISKLPDYEVSRSAITQLVEQTGELLASGDLTAEIGVEADDEVGQLARNFRQVVEVSAEL